MRRFFVAPEGIKDNKAYITGSDAHHITQVLRLKKDDKIIVIDGTGLEYETVIKELKENCVAGEIVGVTSSKRDARTRVTLVQGVPKGDRMELIIQKCTELGVVSIIPVITQRTVVKLDDVKRKQRVERWQKIAQEASKQCKRAIVPTIDKIYDWDDYLKEVDEGEEVLVLWEDESTVGLKEILTTRTDLASITLVVGPEGGFTNEEVAKLKGRGAHSVSIGSRILRTETAGFAAIIMTLYEFGDLG
ncbi:MAG: 16S rRNA (uracil(1498)-N(3))-methyltransferase [Bacillota bacterium]